ncbi:MAG: KilA-N domain-containing protein [Pseudomonadota bacterium]
MSDLTKFDYKGNSISFEFSDGSRMINATEMIKAFPEKRINNFLRTKQTQQYILILQDRYAKKRIADNQPIREVLRVVKGGLDQQGTWMDEILALKFAAWLSPYFELWVYDRIHELLTTGRTELKQTPSSNIVKSIRLIADQLEAQAANIQSNSNRIQDIEEVVQELEAKILSVDEGYYTIAGYCNLHKIKCPLHKAKEWGKAATALSRQKNIPTGTAHDERFGKVRTYHKEVLGEVVKKS